MKVKLRCQATIVGLGSEDLQEGDDLFIEAWGERAILPHEPEGPFTHAFGGVAEGLVFKVS